jgi:hypothetical protein
MDKQREIVQEILRVSRAVAPRKLTKQLFKRESSIPENRIRYYFGTWNKAVAAAGLRPNPSGPPPSSHKSLGDDELLAEIGVLWEKHGRRPSEALMNSDGKFSTKPYKKRWGSFSQGVDEYIRRFGEGNSASSAQQRSPSEVAVRTTVAIPETHKPKATAKRDRVLFGEPIEFRGLRFAPVNEQGVVYLFGMVSRELGFLLESVRTEFPDCEGKRALDRAETRWQHVRIEFEYRSRNFYEHGHDPEQCDLIVCWIHDWEDCPIEVLELKTAVTLLPHQ